MQSETWIQKAGFRSQTKIGFPKKLKKRLFNPRVFDDFFQLGFSIQYASRIRVSKKFESLAALLRVLHTHAPCCNSATHDTTPLYTFGDTASAAVTPAAARRESA